ncbi:hypothetical protein DL96DRAFT_885966 [Flagelloscypha sp. PMI_526]|nr:hypothetical protein DL96DRAFT_885966 [Flagelloscypha sp. PMI_526]
MDPSSIADALHLLQKTSIVDSYYMVALMTNSIFFGCFLILSGISFSILRARWDPTTRPSKVLRWTILGLLITTFATFSTQSAISFTSAGWAIHGFEGSSPRVQWERRSEKGIIVTTISTILIPLNYAVADAIPTWRACVFWSESKHITRGILTLYAFNVVTTLAHCSFGAFLQYRASENYTLIFALYALQCGFSATTNAIATGLIGLKAMRHRNAIRKNHLADSPTIGILVLLMEMGVLLCTTQLINVVMSLYFAAHQDFIDILQPYSLAQLVLSNLSDAVAASYPALTVIALSLRGPMLGETSAYGRPPALQDVERQAYEKSTLPAIQFAPKSSDVTVGTESSVLVIGKEAAGET